MTDFISGKLQPIVGERLPFQQGDESSGEKLEDNEPRDKSHSHKDWNGKYSATGDELFDISNQAFVPTKPLRFSSEAQAVFEAGRELWTYYHNQENINPNASLYDIKSHFQGVNAKGKMNNKSTDEHYNLLIANLRDNLKTLALKIQPTVYQYGFLKG
jgi:hypothetical protein